MRFEYKFIDDGWPLTPLEMRSLRMSLEPPGPSPPAERRTLPVELGVRRGGRGGGGKHEVSRRAGIGPQGFASEEEEEPLPERGSGADVVP